MSLENLPVPGPGSDEQSVSDGDGRDSLDLASESEAVGSQAGDMARVMGMLTRLTARVEAIDARSRSSGDSGGLESALDRISGLRAPPRQTRSGSPSLKSILRQSVGGHSTTRTSIPSADADSDGEESQSSQATRPEDRLGASIMGRIVRNHGSALNFVRNVDFKNTRAMHEARRVAQAIDAFQREGVGHQYEGMEILLRTLAGLYKADEFGSQDILEQLEWAPPEDILPRGVVRTAVKDAQRQAKLRPTKKKPAPGGDRKKNGPPGAGK